MGKTKGEEKKEHILNTCRELFYKHGYKATSVRMISKEANINLGLLNYYFDGKVEIGDIIYRGIRRTFRLLIEENEPGISEKDLFFFNSAIELQLCLQNTNYGRFFIEITHEDPVYKHWLNIIIERFNKYAINDDANAHLDLQAISISSIKRSLVRHSLDLIEKDIDAYVLFYLEEQLHYFGMDKAEAFRYLDMLKKYHIDIASNFTPIFVKIK